MYGQGVGGWMDGWVNVGVCLGNEVGGSGSGSLGTGRVIQWSEMMKQITSRRLLHIRPSKL